MLTATLERIAVGFWQNGIVMDKTSSPDGTGFTLASGRRSLLYIDHRLLVSFLDLKPLVLQEYQWYLRPIKVDRLANVPDAATALTSSLSDLTGIPMVLLSKAAKDHGTGKRIHGRFQPGERVVLIEDLTTTGGSTLEYVELLRGAGCVVTDVVVFMDREQGAAARLAEAGVTLTAATTAREFLRLYCDRGLMDPATYAEIIASVPEWNR